METLFSCIPLIVLLLLAYHVLPSSGLVHDIAAFGSRSDGRTDSTGAVLSAWKAACGSEQPSTVYVPPGRFLVSRITFQGPCKSDRITVEIDGTIVGPSNSSSFGKHRDWMVFDGVNGLSIHGGTIDGRGQALWACKAAGRNCPAGATSLTLSNSKNVVIAGLTSIDSELYHIVIEDCDDVTVRRVKITAPRDSPNTDGIHIQMSKAVTVAGAAIGTGDDCISIGPGATGLLIEHVVCGPGHGISIGSLGKGAEERGVENVTVRVVAFVGTRNGLRIKTWGRPSDGFVRGAAFRHVLMRNVDNPIIIDQNYCPDNRDCPGQNSGVKISEVVYSDIRGSSATPVAMNFDCSASRPCTGIGLENIQLTYRDRPARSSCRNVVGTVAGYIVPPSCL